MKLKTHKATIKRVRATKTGKLLRLQSSRSHLLTHKRARSKMPLEVSGADIKKVKELAPYL